MVRDIDRGPMPLQSPGSRAAGVLAHGTGTAPTVLVSGVVCMVGTMRYEEARRRDRQAAASARAGGALPTGGESGLVVPRRGGGKGVLGRGREGNTVEKGQVGEPKSGCKAERDEHFEHTKGETVGGP